jgi:hypothetical protein
MVILVGFEHIQTVGNHIRTGRARPTSFPDALFFLPGESLPQFLAVADGGR